MALAKSSHELVADTQITKGAGTLTSVLVLADGTNAATAIVYDVAAVGDIDPSNKLFEWTVAAGDNQGGRNWVHPVYFSEGLYMDITGTGASCIVEHSR
jgi:hypothetical protein